MSYIRATSNSEGLYIVGPLAGSSGKNITIWCDQVSDDGLEIPVKIFETAALKWDRECPDKLNYRGLIIEELNIPGKGFRIRLEYAGIKIDMYEVTWRHIVSNIKNQKR